jgi:hypothetical protein
MNDRNTRVTIGGADCWIAVYSELVRSAEAAMSQAQSRAPGPEIQLLQAHLSSFRDRLAFWRMHRGRDELLERPVEGSWLIGPSAPEVSGNRKRPAGAAGSAVPS